jgi:hypothetical protein
MSKVQEIADAIVELVERTNGPVTLARIEREVSGFAKKEPPTFQYSARTVDEEAIIWDGMSEAGATALRVVMVGHRVAVQPVDVRPYLAEGYLLKNGNWFPVVLLPARAANLQARNWLVRASPELLDDCVVRGKAGALL